MAAQERSSLSVPFARLPSVIHTVTHSAEPNIKPGKLATHHMAVGVGEGGEEGVDMVDGVEETTMVEINLGRVAIHLTRLLCLTLVDFPTGA